MHVRALLYKHDTLRGHEPLRARRTRAPAPRGAGNCAPSPHRASADELGTAGGCGAQPRPEGRGELRAKPPPTRSRPSHPGVEGAEPLGDGTGRGGGGEIPPARRPPHVTRCIRPPPTTPRPTPRAPPSPPPRRHCTAAPHESGSC
ncbi:hypothetical protein FNV66_29630 [Streptomyces sp. S1D4-14]|nr:hypothetical protein FNV66_29630 [Streptomyces sp. S1D4-14]